MGISLVLSMLCQVKWQSLDSTLKSAWQHTQDNMTAVRHFSQIITHTRATHMGVCPSQNIGTFMFDGKIEAVRGFHNGYAVGWYLLTREIGAL